MSNVSEGADKTAHYHLNRFARIGLDGIHQSFRGLKDVKAKPVHGSSVPGWKFENSLYLGSE